MPRALTTPPWASRRNTCWCCAEPGQWRLECPKPGSMPLPKYLAAQGVEDMVRVSDGRMSGTAYGTVALHVAPEAAVGGPLALVRDGDLIELDVQAGRLDLLVPEETLARRRAEWTAPATPARGWRQLYTERVLQAHLGADLDFC